IHSRVRELWLGAEKANFTGRVAYRTTFPAALLEGFAIDQCSLAKLRAAFAGFHEQVRRVVNACPRVHKWAIVDRDPLPSWGDGAVVLLGDAAHPMTQYMAQGAASAMEDAVVLSRCITATPGDMPGAFARYE